MLKMPINESPTTADVHKFARVLVDVERVRNHGQWTYDDARNIDTYGRLKHSAILTGPDCFVEVHHFHSGHDRIMISSWVPWDLSDGSRFHQPYKFERAKVSIAWGREPIAATAALFRTVVPNAQALYAEWREQDETRKTGRANQAIAVAGLERAGFQVHPCRDDELERSFTTAWDDKPRISGRLVAGSLYAVEISGLDVATLADITRAIRGES